jgi:two-component system, OmpR family, sensor histidine kinase BaeS
MKIGITYRLFISILGATGLAILCLFLVMWWSIDRGFYQYLNTLDQGRLPRMAAILEEAYAEHGGWGFLRDSSGAWIGRLLNIPVDAEATSGVDAEATSGKAGDSREKGGGAPAPTGSKGVSRSRGPLIILDADRRPLFGFIAEGDEADFQPIVHRGATIGHVGLLSPKHFLHPLQVRFLSQQRLALVLAAAGMVIVVIIISFPLARRLVRPIKAMAAATHDIASGRYATRVPFSSSDELGSLARDFNNMALTLEKHEREQRQWIADISHELRTPVAVLRGEIEALLDGIRPVTPETILSLHAETLRLNRLLEDLYQLALSDIGALTYRKEEIDPAEVLEDAVDNYRAEFARKHIGLTIDIPKRPEIAAFADRERLYQLFANLLDNTLKYTDEEGELVVRLSYADGWTTIDFQDSPPGAAAASLERLFDRLYRVEESRSRASGGAGLGLAICRNIVEGHDGTIAAYPSPLGGIGIMVTLPASARSL